MVTRRPERESEEGFIISGARRSYVREGRLRSPVVALVAAVLSVALIASAAPAYCTDPASTITVGGFVGYLVLDCFQSSPNCGYYDTNFWVYEESNDIPGLQRGGRSDSGQEDNCQLSLTPDHLIM